MDETTPISRGDQRRVLAGRYVLRGLLGSGGMADVELAHDEVLDRQVAVKILHGRYTNDPAFVERFKREARTAASLNHPNMVAVYDTGVSDGRPFIVMEYVAGRTLRDILRTEGVLPHRALEIARDTAKALYAAHERGLIHRDVKPANIMISDEGRVKVTDFGIARAVGAETITQTATVFGTAAYIAPEQAQGRTVDGRTDVYSLGVVLYEMLSGQPPFVADTPVALAYKHVSEQPIPPTQLNREITPAMERVVATAMAKNPEQRYASARDFADDLERVLEGLPIAGGASFAATTAINRTAYIPRTAPAVAYTEEEELPRRSSAWLWWLLVLLVLGLLAAIGWYLLSRPEPPPTVDVPRVVGASVGEARQILQNAGLTSRIRRVDDPNAPENTVVRQNPTPGTEVEQGSEVTLHVSQGPPLVAVPRLVGLPEQQALDLLQNAGLDVGTRTEERNDEFNLGVVISTNPRETTEVEEGARVDYVVSAGPETVTIPPVQGMNEESARTALRESCDTPPCLDIDTEAAFSDDVEEGDAIGTDPPSGTTVPFGSTVILVISEGPEPEPSPTPEPTPTPSLEPTPTESLSPPTPLP